MVSKSLINPERIRRVPKQFSWVDHRLIRDGHIERLSHADGLLYLFLTTVGDSRGLSYYGDKSIMKRLNLQPVCLDTARNHLVELGLIAWQHPLYQVLSLDEAPQPVRPPMAQPVSMKTLFKQIAGGGR